MSEETFSPQEHLMKLSGRDYLPVAPRVLWFRKERPIEEGWGIRTYLIDGGWGKGYAVFKAEVTDGQGRVIATGTAVEVEPVLDERTRKRVDGFPDYVEKAETSAIGRAIGTAGYGTAAALDEGDVVDAPLERQPSAPRVAGYPKPPDTALKSCPRCEKPMTQAQVELSTRKFGAVACPACQKELVAIG